MKEPNASTLPAPESKPRGFDPPAQPVWHRMIAEAAYFLAEKRGFGRGHALEDWVAAEHAIKIQLSEPSSPPRSP